MKILHVITSLRTGGAEKLMVDLLPRLRDLGNEVELLVFDGIKTPFYEQLEAEGIKIHALRIGGSVYNPMIIFKLIPYLKKFDIVHTHNTAPQLFAAIAHKFCSNCRLITTEHSTNNRRRSIKFFSYIDKWMYRQYAHIICISNIAETSLKNYLKGRNDNISTINNGVNISKYMNADPDQEILNQFKGKKTAIMVAGFRWEKDHKTLIKAYQHLPEEYHLLLAGTGVLQPEYEKMCQELDLKDRIHFLGMRSDIPQLLKSVDVVIMSSHFEGLSLSSIEGMASGKPFIASDVNGLKEVVEGAGVLFPHEDDKTLAEEIQKLSENTEYRKKVISLCQQKAKQFDIKLMTASYNKLYNNH